jgi:drug/metabolite transporter (DMT)-like permease
MRSIVLLLISTMLWGFWGWADKAAVSRAHPFVISWMYAIPYALSIPIFFYLGSRADPQNNLNGSAIGWAVVAGLAATAASLLFFFALQDHPASVAVAITSAYPLVTLLLGLLSRTERLDAVRLAGMALILAGVYLIQR